MLLILLVMQQSQVVTLYLLGYKFIEILVWDEFRVLLRVLSNLLAYFLIFWLENDHFLLAEAAVVYAVLCDRLNEINLRLFGCTLSILVFLISINGRGS